MRKREWIWNGSYMWFIIFINVFILGSVVLAHLHFLSPKSDTLLIFYLLIWKLNLCSVGPDWPAVFSFFPLIGPARLLSFLPAPSGPTKKLIFHLLARPTGRDGYGPLQNSTLLKSCISFTQIMKYSQKWKHQKIMC